MFMLKEFLGLHEGYSASYAPGGLQVVDSGSLALYGTNSSQSLRVGCNEVIGSGPYGGWRVKLYTNRMKHWKHGVPMLTRFKIFSSEHELDLAGTGLVIEVGDGVAQTVWEPSLHRVKPKRFILGRRVFLPWWFVPSQHKQVKTPE